jgi:hypothetical protein
MTPTRGRHDAMLRPTHGGDRHRLLLANTLASWHVQEGRAQGRFAENRRGACEIVNMTSCVSSSEPATASYLLVMCQATNVFGKTGAYDVRHAPIVIAVHSDTRISTRAVAFALCSHSNARADIPLAPQVCRK